MRPNIVSPEILEDILQALVRAGGYPSKKAAVGHGLEVLLVANPHLRTHTAIELYRRGKVTLSRAAEIAQLELEAFKEQLAEKDLPLRIDEPTNEVRAGVKVIHCLRASVCLKQD